MLDVVRAERVLDLLMLNIMHVRTFVEECTTNSFRRFLGQVCKDFMARFHCPLYNMNPLGPILVMLWMVVVLVGELASMLSGVGSCVDSFAFYCWYSTPSLVVSFWRRRRRPLEGCTRTPVGNTPASTWSRWNPCSCAMLGMVGAKRDTGSCVPRDHQLSGSLVVRMIFENNICTHQHHDLPLGLPGIFFAIKYLHILYRKGNGGGMFETLFGEGRGCERIATGGEALELAPECRETLLGKGTRYMSTLATDAELTRGEERDTTVRHA
jgi:hypothetical protein